jgi:hypothetical protein
MRLPFVPLVVASALIASLSDVAQPQLNIVALDVHAPVAPSPLPADGRLILVYELRVTNVGPKQRALSGLEIRGEPTGTSLAKLSSDDLKGMTRSVASAKPDADGRVIDAGRQAIVYLWLPLPAGAPVPARLHHRFIVSPMDSATSTRRDTLDGPDVPVVDRPAHVIGAPFAGGPWFAANGPGNTSGHRRTAIPLDGLARISQRFATDWVKFGPDGRLFHGDSSVNANWYGFGTPVVAIGDGVVTETLDSVPENVPLSPTRAVPITLKTVAGNHVLLDLGGGAFAMYAHLQPGSLKVKVGDHVTRGQAIGLLGNTGNSDAPHLHFQLMDRSSPLGSEGIPFVFERFELLDRVPKTAELPETWKQPAGPASTQQREAVLENMVVRFP